MSAMLTADWCLLGKDTYYRKFEVYSMAWPSEINLDKTMIAAAPLGGPVAIVRDRTKFVPIHTGSATPVISIYSGSGIHIGSIVWESGVLITFGWSDQEELLCVQENGACSIYDLFGNFQNTFGMNEKVKNQNVIDAKIFYKSSGTGIAVLTSSFKIYLVNNIKEPKVRELATVSVPPSLSSGVAVSWNIICDERETEAILVYAGSCDLYRLTSTECVSCRIHLSQGNILKAAISVYQPDTPTSLALFTDAGILWMGTLDLKSTYREVELEKRTPPKQIVWCSSEAVVCSWPGLLVLVSRYDGEVTQFYYDTAIHLGEETDCVRIISAYQHEILQKVPPVVQTVLRINSTDPGSYLLEASKHYQKRSHRADEYIGLVKDNLRLAVKQCINVAAYEFDTDTQKMLLRAAQFGNCFISGMNPNEFVTMCRDLRVLNSVRDKRIGISITYDQIKLSGYRNLLDRLVARKHYFLAIQIAKYLQLPYEEGESRILVHWACYKVQDKQLDEDTLAQEIAKKLGNTPGVSYSYIASKAAAYNLNLAIKLLDYETKARDQVPLLLKLEQPEAALIKSIESGDTDLVYRVIFEMSKVTPSNEFKITIHKYPMALALYQKHCKQHNPQALFKLYHQEDDFNAQAIEHIRESLDPKNASYREGPLSSAQIAYKSARNELHASFCEEAQKLIKHQKKFEETLEGVEFNGRSVHDTLHILLKEKAIKLAEKLRSEYKVPDRRYWWLRIQTFGEQGDWEELEKFSKSKKSPIGYTAFVDVCLKHGNRSEALKYLPKVQDDLKVKYYVKAERLEDAAQIAYEQKDLHALNYVQGKSNNHASVLFKISTYKSQLSNKK